jgi:hypothetical protein
MGRIAQLLAYCRAVNALYPFPRSNHSNDLPYSRLTLSNISIPTSLRRAERFFPWRSVEVVDAGSAGSLETCAVLGAPISARIFLALSTFSIGAAPETSSTHPIESASHRLRRPEYV